MKKQHRIISLLLVISMLLGSIVFTASADLGSGDVFVPTATIKKFSNNGAFREYALGGSGNHILDATTNSFGDDYSTYIVTPADGSAHYLQITSQADEDGQPDNHVQYTWRAGDGATIKYDAATPVYVVYQMDIATESDLTQFMAVARISNSSNSDRGGTSNLALFGANGPVNFAAGEFHRYTQVQDFAGNKIYHFVDDVLITSSSLLNDSVYANWKTDADGWYSGFKFQAHSSYGKTPVVENESLLIANAQATVIRGTSAAGNLPTALSAGSLVGWTGAQKATHELPKVPAIATVDGTPYNNVKDLNAALAGGTRKNVVLLRDALTKFTVDCDAVITTNGFSTYKLGSGATSVDNGDGTVTVTAEFTNALTRENYSTTNYISDGANYLSKIPGNNLYGVSTGNNTNSAFLSIVKATPANGDPFIQAYCNTTTSYKGGNNNLFIAASMNNSAPFTVVGDNLTAYYVIDFDVATQGDILPGFDISVPMRRNSDKGGYPFSDEIFFDGLITDKNAWSHVTVVGDIANNVTRIYVNGVYMGNGGLAVRNQPEANKLASDTQVVAQGFRIELTRNDIQTDRVLGQNVAFDNFSHRLYADGNSDLKAAIESGDITAWDAYVDGKAGDDLPVIATVNGTPYYNTAELTTELVSNDNLNIEFGSAPLYPILLRANAVVDTNGLDLDSLVTIDPTAEITSTDGNYVTVSCAYIPNMDTRDVNYTSQTAYETDVFNAIKGNAANNLFNRFNPVSSAAWGNSWGTPGYRYGEIVSNPFVGDSIYHEYATLAGGATKLTGTNDYVNFFFNSVTLSYESGKNEYIVMDYDFAVDGDLDTSMGFSIIPRNSGGRWANGVSLHSLPLTKGDMVHITAVHDYTNNKAYYFFDGVHGYTANSGAINDTGYTEYKNGAKTITVTEYKLGSNSINSIYVDNMNIRFFDIASGSDTLATAIAAGDITKWTDNIYEAGTHSELPAVATVNGIETSSVAVMNELILENPGAEVEILHDVEGTVTVAGVAKINTHGFNFDVAEPAGGNIIVDGDWIYVAASNISETVTSNTSNIANAIKYNKTGNLLSYISLTSTGDNDTISWGNEGGRGSSLITNPSTGNVYYHEYLVGEPMANYDKNGNDFANYVFTTQNLQYTAGNNEYIIVDYDLYHIAGDGGAVAQQVIVRNLNGTSWAITQQLKDLGLVEGEFNHVTSVYDYTTAAAHIFVNGKLTKTVNNGALASANHTAYLAGTTGGYTQELRIGSNTKDIINLDNLCIRYEKNAVASDTLATAIDTGYITAWQNNYFTDSYEIPQNPPIATINGVDTYNEATLANALTGRDKVEVSMWRSPASPLEVTTDAVINTNGFQNVFTVGAGAAIESTVGTTTYIDAAFKESATYVAGGDGTTAGSFSDHTDLSIPKNVYNTTAGETSPGSFRYFKFTDYASRNPYYMINPIVDISPKNTFVDVKLSTYPAITATSYFIFDIDLATETDYIDKLGITIQQRSAYSVKDGGGTDFNLVADTTQVNFGDYLDPSDKWAHMTLVGDVADNTIYIFVDGELVGTKAMVEASKYQSVGYATFIQNHIAAGDFICSGTRINMAGSVPMDQSATTLFDGVSLRYYASNDKAADIEAAISTGTLENYALAEFGRMGDSLPAIATVNGVEHGNLYKADEALFRSENIEASLDRSSFFGNVTIASTGTVVCNGMTYTVGLGYVASEDGGVVTLEYTKDTGHVNISINGVTIFQDNVRIGTDLSEVLASLGAYGTDVVAGNGNIFTNVKWNSTPGYVTGDAGYEGTGTKVENLFYAHNDGVVLDGVTYTEEGFQSLINNSTPATIILNDSISISSNNSIGNGKKIYLNGNALSFGGGNHAMSSDAYKEFSIYGPGVINDMCSNNTQALFYAGYGNAGKFSLNNLTVNTTQALFQLRAGNAEINNCEIYAFSVKDTPLFQVGEDYNTSYSTTPIQIDIIDSYVNFRASNTESDYPIPLLRQKIVTRSTDPNHVVNVVGSTIVSEYALFEANQTISGNTVTNSNMVINVSDSKLVSSSLTERDVYGKPTGFFATINFLDNVSINSNMANLADATIANTLEVVKSNDHAADVTYSSEYATVTWANGTVELWADGSVPVNEALGFVKVSEVKAGESYTFDQKYGSAPISLSANLTLSSAINFNLYVPVDADVQSVVVNGVALTGVEKNLNNVLSLCYTVELDPAEAVSAFDVVFTLADGNVVARTFSVAQYASAIYSAYASNAATVKMMSNTLKYIKASATYFGNNADASAIDTLLSKHAATTETVSSTTTDASALTPYISGVQLNVMSTLKFRFNLVGGVDGSKIKVTVNGEAKEVEVYGSYVEVALRAYEMGDKMTITVNGATGTYDLATYCNYVTSNANEKGDYNTRSYYVLTDAAKGNLANAIYSYYVAASEYKN